MAMLTWIPECLRAAGLTVVEYDGWRTRTTRASGLVVKGVVCHHTATGPSTSNTAVARLLAVGRSDLKGPLSQLGLDRDGHFWMIAAGRCNHNGLAPTWGNDSIGIEAYNDGRGEPWPAKQIDAYQRGVAALLAHEGLTVAHCRGHKETDPNRKIDPAGINMDRFRARVADLLEEGDDMKDEDWEKLRDIVRDEIDGSLARRGLIAASEEKTGGAMGEARRNLRTIAAKVGVPADQIEK